MGNCINKSTFQSEQATVTKKYEEAIKGNITYNTARSDIEAILNTVAYTELEVDEVDYPTGLEKVVSVFPVVDSNVVKTVTIQILYQCDENAETHYLLHVTLLPGIDHEAITLVPHKNDFPEEKPADHQYDHSSLNTLSTVKRKKTCEPDPCDPCCYRKYYCSDYHKHCCNDD